PVGRYQWAIRRSGYPGRIEISPWAVHNKVVVTELSGGQNHQWSVDVVTANSGALTFAAVSSALPRRR
ncbi:hypothetical protein J6590_035553, partial [Homalodisca vitripennis]